ncbi:MAG: hypothetical protein IPO72_20165 [Saprospiraceae bacterium]|nr:hypothetical protein [Candidatus Vicinibacter affinis]
MVGKDCQTIDIMLLALGHWQLFQTVPFFQLDRIATKSNYTNYGHITTDPDLNSLHNDNRWKPLIEKIKQNKDKAEVSLNKPLVAILDSIYIEDQTYRKQIDGIEKKIWLGIKRNERPLENHKRKGFYKFNKSKIYT